MSRKALVVCFGCGKPYGAWPDLLVPDAVWEIINPTSPRREGGGLLCPNCIHDRCAAAGLSGVPVAYASGPLRSVEYVAGTRTAFLNSLWRENAVKAPTAHVDPLKPPHPTQPENAP